MGGLTLSQGQALDDAPRQEGVLSLVVVVEGGSRGPRRLPSLYLGPGLIFADRDVGKVVDRLQQAVEMVVAGDERRTYVLHPCSLEGKHGLYGKDFFNRSGYRRRLIRTGMTFSRDPYPRFGGDGTFWCEEWGPFSPRFVILPAEGEEPSQVVEVGGALAALALASYRIGRMGPQELHDLARLSRSMRFLGAGDPEALAHALQ